jgi:hypothetical protein
MLWLKRNWMLLVMGLVALGLLAGAIVYLITQKQRAISAAKALKTAQEDLTRLRNFDPSLDDANIQKVQEEIKWLQEYLPQIKPLLQADTNVAVNLDPLAFKSLLENTIAQLTGEAESAGITLRPRYSFTFEAQRQMTQFPSNTIPVLAAQLYEVKELCQILFNSKVHSLEGLKRVRAYPEEPAGGSDYVEGKSLVSVTAASGQVFSITPYEVSFRGFTGELSAVLNALVKSKFFFSVKRVNIQAMEVTPVVDVLPAPPAPGTPKAPPGKKAAPTAPPPAAVQTVMDEKPLRISLFLEVVKALPAAPAAATGATQ